MATVSRGLPDRPHLDVPKLEARTLLKEWRARLPEALERIGKRHPRFRNADRAATSAGKFLLNDAQLVVAREYGFSNWAELKERIKANTVAGLLQEAIHQMIARRWCGCCGRIRICCTSRCGAGIGDRR